MKRARRSSSSKASSPLPEDPVATFAAGADDAWTCQDNSLRRIANPKLPAMYRAACSLEFAGESLAVSVNGAQHPLQPRPDQIKPVVSLVREGRVLAESAPMSWQAVDGISVRRTIRLVHCDQSFVKIALRFQVKNESGQSRALAPTLQWQLTLPPCVAFLHDPASDVTRPFPDGEVGRQERQSAQLIFSFQSRQIDSTGNRLLMADYSGIHPNRLMLAGGESEPRVLTALFTSEIGENEAKSFQIELGYKVLLPQHVSSTVFLVARSESNSGPWQGALAATMTWIDRLEPSRETNLCSSGFQRFAPFLWFDRNKPLPDQVLRFLHDVPNLLHIVVIGEVLRHDLEHLLTALLDKGGAQPLRLQIFTQDEYYRDLVNVLRGNLQARMIIADEPTGRVRRIEHIISVTVVENPDLLPLAVRRFVEDVHRSDSGDVFAMPRAADRAAFLVPAESPNARFLAAATIPMARHLAAPVLLWSRGTERETLAHLLNQRLRQIYLVGRFDPADFELLGRAVENSVVAGSKVEFMPFRRKSRFARRLRWRASSRPTAC